MNEQRPSNQVLRYDLYQRVGGGEMGPHPTGDYVGWEDYERLQQELKSVAEQYTNYHDWATDEIERLRQDLARTESARVAILAENGHYKQRCAQLERNRDALEADLKRFVAHAARGNGATAEPFSSLEHEAGGSRERGTSPNRSCGTAGQSGPASSLHDAAQPSAFAGAPMRVLEWPELSKSPDCPKPQRYDLRNTSLGYEPDYEMVRDEGGEWVRWDDIEPHLSTTQPPGAPPAYDRDKHPTACLAVQAFVDDYVDDYEMIGEDPDGCEGVYTPNDHEDNLIRDAINGLVADEEFIDLIAAEYAERQARRTAEGSCLTCGAPAGQHWGMRCTSVTKE